MNEWQPDLRRWTPSSSARYPLRMKIPKPSIDPETRKLVMFHPALFGKMCLGVEFTSLILVPYLTTFQKNTKLKQAEN